MSETDIDQGVELNDGVSVTSLDELRAYLHSETGISVGDNDPILMEFVMHQLFLSDLQVVLRRHNKALTEVMETAVRGLTADAISKNLQEQVRLAERTHQVFEDQYKKARRLAIINSVTVGLAVFICLPVIIYLLINI